MPRLNNKDFTVDELERLIYLINNMMYGNTKDSIIDEIKVLLKGITLMSDEKLWGNPVPIEWNFKFNLLMPVRDYKHSQLIKNAMRDSEVNEKIKQRFINICYEELNWYQDRVKVFMINGDSNILE